MQNKFESAIKNTLNNETTVTENGACGFKTSGSGLLDFSFAVSSFRGRSETEIAALFGKAYCENPLLAVKFMFMLRDIRGNGMGERRSFRVCLKWLAAVRPDIVRKLVPLCAVFGRWDDVFCLLGTPVEDDVVACVQTQWSADMQSVACGDPVSLLAKWMPSVTTSSRDTVRLGRFFAKRLGLSEKRYRKALSAMRSRLDVTEARISAGEWDKVDYGHVCSQANVKYRRAFLRHDKARRTEYLAELGKGKAKINSTASFPSDIVHAYNKTERRSYEDGYLVISQPDPALEAMWKALPNIAVNGNVLAVADGSGSMCSPVSNGSNVTALEVCNALAIYCAEHCTGPFNNKYITFSNRPQYVDMSKAKSLAEKLSIAYQHNECANTNIEATFDLVLQSAIDHNLKQEDIPTLVILSDMEMDAGADFGVCRGSSPEYSAGRTALMENIRRKWADHGFSLPRMMWWNICSRTGVIPLRQNPDTGMLLCSGYSQSQFNMIASNQADPYDALVESINVPRYQPVEDAVREII